MASRDGRKQFAAELPVEVIDAVREEADKTGKPMWEIITDSARMRLGLDDASTEASVERHIERLEGQVDELQEQKADIEAELSSKQERLNDYREKLAEIQEQKESYETRLDRILEDLESNSSMKVIACRKQIKSMATDRYGKPSTENRQEVKDDLWERAMEQQRDVAPYQFSESTTGVSPQRAATDGAGDDKLPSEQKSEFGNNRGDADDDRPDDGVDRGDGIETDGGRQLNKELVDAIGSFYRSYYRDEIAHVAQNYTDERSKQRSLTIDWWDVYNWDRDVADDILNGEAKMRKYFGAALSNFDLPADIDLSSAEVRFANVDEAHRIHVDELRSEEIGGYREIIGQVKQRTGAKPVCTEGAWECQRCGTMNYVPQEDGDYQEPHDCQGCEREGPFKIDYDQSEFKDFERLRIVEPPERTQGADGQSVDVTVDRDLVDSCNPGDRVHLAGNVSAVPPEDGGDGMFEYEIEGRSIKHTQETYDEIELDNETIEKIHNVVNDADTDPFATLINSIQPGHYGDEHIKLSIGLQLFAGVRGEQPDGSTERGDIHVLMMGDPGTGKSMLLEAAEEIAPRSASASGKGASKAGLTAAALPSDFADNGMTLEAGALVLADKGLAAIDEIDKIPDEVSSAMHGAMSKQRVEISKGGFSNVSLPSRTSVLAAGNPKWARFDQYEPMGEQLELPGALMDRFDLIWTMIDDPDADHDNKVADHILDTVDAATRNVAGGDVDGDVLDSISADVDQEFLRHWIAYARKNYYPTLPQEVKDRIKEFWSELRSVSYGNEDTPIPVTKRKLKGLVRIAQASARVRLSDEVNREDAERACRLMLQSMKKVGIDPETGQFDADIVETGTSKAQRDRIKSLKSLIAEIEDEYADGAPIDEVLARAEDIGLDPEKAEQEVENLYKKGELYENVTDHYRTT